MLEFSANQPVVPARIAAVNENSLGANIWRVITIAPEQLRLQAGGFNSELHFSGTLSSQGLADFPAVASLGSAGKRVTKLDIYFHRGAAPTHGLVRGASDHPIHNLRSYLAVEAEVGAVPVSPQPIPTGGQIVLN